MTPARGLDPRELQSLVEKRLDDYLDDLRTLVDVDCGTFLHEGVNRVADVMQSRLREAGWRVERRPHRPDGREERLGDVLVATLHGALPASRGGVRVLLVGHMDTVFAKGTARARPFRVEGERALGPGVADMKGGLLAGLYAVKALQDAGFDAFDSLTYVCNPDEEIGSPFSTPVIREAARGADVAFVLEAARENGDLVSARKGVRHIHVDLHGRAAHAGVEPERGASATLQAAHTTVALHALNGRWPGVTVNVGVVMGGTRANVVAERCELHVDLRSPRTATLREAVAEIEALGASTVVPGVTGTVTVRGDFDPMERSEGVARLAGRAVALARELGFEVRESATGGASDANTIASLGVPVLDGLGPVGGAAHSSGEWLDLWSIVPRVALLAALIVDAANGQRLGGRGG